MRGWDNFLTLHDSSSQARQRNHHVQREVHPAPQQDPDDVPAGPAYSQAPPSYQAADDEARLFAGEGVPRSSEDNVPDDFKFGGSVAEATIDIRNQFVRKVYTILTVQLLATGAVSTISFVSPAYKEWIQGHPALVFISMFGAIGMMLLTYWKRHSYPTNLLFLSGFTLLEAYTISVVVSFYKTSIVLNAVLLTAGIFVFLTAFACQTKYDFTSWMPYLFGGLWGLILFGFMAAFFPYSSTGELIYGGLAALIFSGYILVDTQLVMRHHHVEEEIAAAISLYLDIINLFLAILRILNSQQNN
ncbi:hypothetical protein INS49_001601 [Diaporthe citri]|uniref:uncharacterized protein n=1 Tax=Diaporthe citri TaxID=83186 RepID=UPI001C7F37AD|nr:uncharacterized protein INS49_001601 [Diaporthe citri]KAG6367412.1 hypothetical protein INS49_001601 [Diaporthe citri]